MNALKSVFVENLALGEHTFEEAWELFDLLVLIEGVTSNERFERLSVDHSVAELKRAALEKKIATGDADQSDREALRVATESEGRALGSIADLISAQGHHIRVGRTDFRASRATRAEAILEEIDRDRDLHPLVEAGFGLASWEKLRRALAATSVSVGRAGENVAWQKVAPQGGGIVPGYLWLDSGDTPRL
ncbi:hypothetical protein [Promicromonospora sp. NFX87]|uniref:hypothetical protein n=1 Tax=Promicromonospora sp. NFX87 TaxID=3402691 RepID=UPI003AFA9E8D